MRLKLLLFFLFSSGLAAAQLPQINGFVVDAQTGEALQGAIVTDSSGLVSTYTNREGFYNLGVSSGKHLIIITASGYQRNRMVLDIYNNTAYNVEMMRLSEFKNDSHSNVQHTVYDVRSGHVAPLASQVSNMPALLSEPDPVKFLQYLPGVNGGIEGLAGMYVRGGNADQNLITMDGLPIYGNGHLFGFLSNFNPGQVRDVQFYRGVMPARYGGRAGSAMDVSMLEGSRGDAHGSF
ncbi:MAG: TonB-dependent receptor plug domain-containing protein, partial [Bacteroidia bacterium]|nr:TonB-dependent receptor plug domain-containing protein [Bacteroidia bacterium]